MDRNQEIIRTSIVGIIANIFLAAFKAVVGIFASSIAIIMDAVNNFSDALSSAITIIGTKLSERPADRMHPFGHGRVEYFSAIIISIIVLVAGFSSLVESTKKIFHPTEPNYTNFTLIIIIVSIVVKLILGRYVKSKGKMLKSDSLIASGSDALFDAIITLSTLISAIIMLLWNVSIDGYLGTLISIIIIKSGIDMLKSPINELLGSRISNEYIQEIKDEVMTFKGVHGVFDLILHTYGPDTTIGSLHVNVLDTTTASEIHFLERSIAERLHEKFGIIATVGIYAVNTGETKVARMQNDIMKRAFNTDGIYSAHGFFVDFDTKTITFDIMPEYKVKDAEALRDQFIASLQNDYRDYHFHIILDQNFSD
ncbi:cation diffusion facilitator family transporter [Segatella bryantii]|uniref:cation diffusion facilitator family transporter n=1 Tax=Segatella bryantii TaxID=77095 RepID=UPI001EDB1828|nr:cation diffusion facilitator family transporter [Segatella bryantii]MDR4931792.1 cation diffusion facilitator family transporter [Segatella bryantii]UKK75869.1 cation diffusion facilitator family transporter [Segatella bryantii]